MIAINIHRLGGGCPLYQQSVVARLEELSHHASLLAGLGCAALGALLGTPGSAPVLGGPCFAPISLWGAVLYLAAPAPVKPLHPQLPILTPSIPHPSRGHPAPPSAPTVGSSAPLLPSQSGNPRTVRLPAWHPVNLHLPRWLPQHRPRSEQVGVSVGCGGKGVRTHREGTARCQAAASPCPEGFPRRGEEPKHCGQPGAGAAAGLVRSPRAGFCKEAQKWSFPCCLSAATRLGIYVSPCAGHGVEVQGSACGRSPLTD